MDDSYPAAMRRLAELAAALQARRDEAHHWYAQRRTIAQDAVSAAQAEVDDLLQAHADAAHDVAEVDREAAQIWTEIGYQLGPVADRFGGLPAPAAGPDAAGGPEGPQVWLDRARALAARSAEPGALTPAAQPVLALFGALGAAAAFGLATLARWVGLRYGGDLAVGMPVIALVVTLLGPLFGLAPAKALADRRHAVLHLRAVATVLIAGGVTTVALVGLLR
ncbi:MULTISPECIES: hypothetical protein [unclassified Solwaraspora]|uniref:hypothetical protein n=1 Tax=unclassified Solwaraspora TaxID=2627926 RepID=UPI00259BCAC8|nr:hypothetical protein [Solwaraspora sp. WMMA2056]WJK39035.1 hypothetical protein O7608_21425 [Solwaraspora sp. WMMA2056]